MNIKSARHKVGKIPVDPKCLPMEPKYFYAQGYVKGYADALRGEEVKALVAAAESVQLVFEHDGTHEDECSLCGIHDALATFRAARGEKE